VRLDKPAGSGGIEVALASTSPSRVAVPADVVVPEGAAEAVFDLEAGPSYGTATVQATLGDTTLQHTVIHQREPVA
jgi:hypothetical protein